MNLASLCAGRPGLRRHTLALLVALVIQGWGEKAYTDDAIEFNAEVLDTSDRLHIDLGQFARAGYIMPGEYPMIIRLNKTELPEQTLRYFAPEGEPKGSQACLTRDIVAKLGLKETVKGNLKWWHGGECLEPASLPGLELHTSLGENTLYINVPQAWLEYTSEDWDPPSRWDDGISGTIFDYSLNGVTSFFTGENSRNVKSLTGYGTTGVNLSAWRFRADWQALDTLTSGKVNGTQRDWQWSRYYAWRALPLLKARFMLGENYLNSGVFDSFRYTGSSVESDENMLPPNLRGYAPEVVGVAKTNAKVTITQQGQVLYETTVAAGPFRIQDLNTAVSGTLLVKVQEQDGTVNTFQVDTANIPYLTRPGRVRYKMALGKPSDYQHDIRGPGFATGEFSWGINNGWSLYGGTLLADDYNALAAGIGRDLLLLGALSFDVTESRAEIPDQGVKSGGSYRLSYSKRFDEYDSQVTFAGYRFSQRNFMSMNEFLNMRYHGLSGNSNKEFYTLAFNKQFRSAGLGAYMNYSHQTYWNRPDNDTYNLSLSRYFDAWQFKNMSLNLSAYRTFYNNTCNDGLYLSLSVPWGNGKTIDFDSQAGSSGNSATVGFFDRMDNNNSYRVKAGMGESGNSVGSAYFSHQGNNAEMNASASYQGSQYHAFGLSLQGGMTATPQGVALHRISSAGGTRMMVDTAGVSGVPVRGYGAESRTNRFGKAVVSDINSYYRSSISVDLNDLADNIEATHSVVEGTLTEGAIGYRRFGVIAGEKAMVTIRLADGSPPPFGATVIVPGGRQAGLVSDEGLVWLTGMHSGQIMNVVWDGQTQCQLRLPAPLPPAGRNLLLPCESLS